MIDSPAGQNAGFYRVGRRFNDGAVTGGWGPWQQVYSVGWRLDGRGRPADGWGPWQKVPGWDFDENQGGAVTLADLDGDGVLDLLVLAVDNPVGQNAGLVRVVPVETDLSTAAEEGVWRILEMDSGVLAVHAALLPTGDVLFFAGSSNNPDAAAAGQYGTRVWHYPAPAMSAPDTPVDLFCCGYAHLPDGRLVAAGAPSTTTRSSG